MKETSSRVTKALILTDIQSDFLPGGALAVPNGDAVIPVANRLQEAFPLVLATQDWHPADHLSFAVNHPGKKEYEQIDLYGLKQTLWPVHCVQGTTGAAFSAKLKLAKIAKVFQKGTDPTIDSYSGFFDNGHRKATGMGNWLKEHHIEQVYLCGLATDYCVKFTALDAIRLGFRTFIVRDACRGINLRPEDSEEALEQLQRAGATVMESAELVKD